MSAPPRGARAPKKAGGKKEGRTPAAAPTPSAPAQPRPLEELAELSEEELDALAAAGPPEDEAPLPFGEVRPVVIGKRGRRGDKPVEMVTIFELDGEPTQIPKNPSAALVLRWLVDVREYGRGEAAAAMAVTLLGRPALDRLAASPDVEPEDIKGIFENVGVVFFASDNYRRIIQEAADPS